LSKDSELKEIDGKREIHSLVNPDVVVKELGLGDRHGIVVPELESGLDLGSSFTSEYSANSLKTAMMLCKEMFEHGRSLLVDRHNAEGA
jgi:hypothetical protein